MNRWSCTECGFELYYPVETGGLAVSHLGLYADAKFRGRALLAYGDHAEQLEQLTGGELSAFWADAVAVGEVLKAIVGASRVNYAVLGNAERHLHIHIIPRVPAAEPLPSRSPWNDSRPSLELDHAEYLRIGQGVQKALAKRRSDA